MTIDEAKEIAAKYAKDHGYLEATLHASDPYMLYEMLDCYVFDLAEEEQEESDDYLVGLPKYLFVDILTGEVIIDRAYITGTSGEAEED